MNLKKEIIPGFLMIFICLANSQTQNENHNDNSSGDTKSSGLFHIPYISSGALNDPVMVLVLHGDAPFSNPSYQYRIAKKIALENNNVVAVGILRPGYTDNEGNSSKGERGQATGDNYTIEVLKSINNLTAELKKKYNPSKVILVGHSGGAAICANLLALYSGIYAHALLISCPCDLLLWRKHMKKLQPEARIWDTEVNSLSPIELIKNIDDSAQIALVHGENDEIVPMTITNKYAKELEANSKKVHFTILENQGHEVAFNKQIFEIIKQLVE